MVVSFRWDQQVTTAYCSGVPWWCSIHSSARRAERSQSRQLRAVGRFSTHPAHASQSDSEPLRLDVDAARPVLELHIVGQHDPALLGEGDPCL